MATHRVTRKINLLIRCLCHFKVRQETSGQDIWRWSWHDLCRWSLWSTCDRSWSIELQLTRMQFGCMSQSSAVLISCWLIVGIVSLDLSRTCRKASWWLVLRQWVSKECRNESRGSKETQDSLGHIGYGSEPLDGSKVHFWKVSGGRGLPGVLLPSTNIVYRIYIAYTPC